MSPSDAKFGYASLTIEGVSDPVLMGRGASGTVYRASQAAFGRTVAVKVLNVTLADDGARRRFERACQALGSLSAHPHVVTLHSAGVTSDGRPYLVMGYLPGGSAATRLPIKWPEATTITMKIAGALASAHAAGILHRDVKPENILFSAYGEPQLADFAVARAGDGSTINPGTGTAAIPATLVHAAPEVVSGLAGTEVADVWSLASTLATMLSGRPPFYREGEVSPLPLMRRILESPPEDLRRVRVPGELCDIIEAALAKDSWERTPSAADFGQALADLQPRPGSAPAAGSIGGEGVHPETATRRRGHSRPNGSMLATPPPAAPAVISIDYAPLAVNPGSNNRVGGVGAEEPATRHRDRGRPDSASEVEPTRPGTPQTAPAGRASTRRLVVDRRSVILALSIVMVVIVAVAVLASSAAHTAGHVAQPPPAVAPSVDVPAATGFSVPDVVGQLTASADTRMQAAGFGVTDASESKTRQPRGTVISQSPAPGTPAAKGTIVTVVSSIAPGFLKDTPACRAWQATSWDPPADPAAYKSRVAEALAAYQHFAQLAPPTLQPVVADMVTQFQEFFASLSAHSTQPQQAYQTFTAGSFSNDFPQVTLAMTIACWIPAA